MVFLILLTLLFTTGCLQSVVQSVRVDSRLHPAPPDHGKAQDQTSQGAPAEPLTTTPHLVEIVDSPGFGYYWLPKVKVQIVIQRGNPDTLPPKPLVIDTPEQPVPPKAPVNPTPNVNTPGTNSPPSPPTGTLPSDKVTPPPNGADQPNKPPSDIAKGIPKDQFVCKISLQQLVVEPDPNYLYRVVFDSSPWRDDTMTISITPDGYLSKVGLTTTDETGQSVLKLVDLAEQVAKDVVAFSPAGIPLGKLGGEFAKTLGGKGKEAPPQEKERHPFLLSMLIDPTYPPELADLQKALNDEDCNVVLAVTDGFGNVVYPTTVQNGETAMKPEEADKRTANKRADKLNGVVYRPLQPYHLTFSNGDAKNDQPGSEHVHIRHTILVPNMAPILSADITRAPLVTTVSSLSFTKGMLTGITFDKKSSVLAGFSLPVDMAKAIAAIPSNLIQLKIDTTTKQTALLAAQQANFTAQQSLQKTIQEQQMTILQIQTDIQNAKTGLLNAQQANETAGQQLERTIASQQNVLRTIQADVLKSKTDLEKAQADLINAQTAKITAQQAQLDNIEKAVTQVKTDLATATKNLQDAIKALKNH